MDHDGNVNARLNQGWSPGNVSKFQAQVRYKTFEARSLPDAIYRCRPSPGTTCCKWSTIIKDRDYSLNGKALNPWPTDLTGIYIGSYLQSVTKNLALGVECLYQRPAPEISELATSYIAKLSGTDKNWIATANFQPAGILQATYWQKLSEKVDVAADLQVIAAPARRDAIATLGVKYDLRLATFRAQVDSGGKVSALLEQRFTPTFTFMLSGEIDHWKVGIFL